MPPNVVMNQSESTAGADSSQDQRSTPPSPRCNDILERRVSVHRGGKEWRKAIVKEFDITTRRHKLQFEDGDEWSVLDSHRTRLIDTPIIQDGLPRDMHPLAPAPTASSAMSGCDGSAFDVLEKNMPTGGAGESGNVVGSTNPGQDASHDASSTARLGLCRAHNGEQLVPSPAGTDSRQISAIGNSISSGASGSHHGFMVLGSRISLLGCGFSPPRKAQVTAYDLTTTSHRLSFDNGREEWLSLKAQRFSWVSPRGCSSGSVDMSQYMRELGAVNVVHAKREEDISKASARSMPRSVQKEDLNNPSQLNGRELSVFWQATEMWCPGEVSGFSSITGRHQILYNDGEEEWLDLSSEQILWGSIPSRTVPHPMVTPVLGPILHPCMSAVSTFAAHETPGSQNQLFTPISKRKASHVPGGMGREDREAGLDDSKRMRLHSPAKGFGSPVDVETAAMPGSPGMLPCRTPMQSLELLTTATAARSTPRLFPGLESRKCSPSRSRSLWLKTACTSHNAAPSLPPLQTTLHFDPTPQFLSTKPPLPGSSAPATELYIPLDVLHTPGVVRTPAPATEFYAPLESQCASGAHLISRLIAGFDEPEMCGPTENQFMTVCPMVAQQSKVQLQPTQLTRQDKVLEAMRRRMRVLEAISTHLGSLERLK
eukprot:gene13747-19649_t